MRTYTGLIAVAVAVAVVAFASTSPVRAAPAPAAEGRSTISTTCQAAADADRHVSFAFCRHQFIFRRGAADADVRGLARMAAVAGVNHADAARYEIESTMRWGRGRDDPKLRRALERCMRLYGAARAAFAAADEAIAGRRYAAAKEALLGAPALGHKCEEAFGEADSASPLQMYSVDNQQMAYIAIGIVNLIK